MMTLHGAWRGCGMMLAALTMGLVGESAALGQTTKTPTQKTTGSTTQKKSTTPSTVPATAKPLVNYAWSTYYNKPNVGPNLYALPGYPSQSPFYPANPAQAYPSYPSIYSQNYPSPYQYPGMMGYNSQFGPYQSMPYYPSIYSNNMMMQSPFAMNTGFPGQNGFGAIDPAGFGMFPTGFGNFPGYAPTVFPQFSGLNSWNSPFGGGLGFRGLGY